MLGKATVGEKDAAPQLHDSSVFKSLVREGNSHGIVWQSAASLSLRSNAIAVEQPGLAQEFGPHGSTQKLPGDSDLGRGN